ncbi:alpha/beta hydrolase domain-containing protein [Microbacterium sp. 2FI]|uniref:alpha/beta hydrolase domain-containing protein n=1 Tax=Microbacterium sp. 2FI TaxID=2502193 RepID=UPI0014858A75|nr:alpha/beta hydrolase domain-containing protein [Microbacterium sp. 2FI]
MSQIESKKPGVRRRTLGVLLIPTLIVGGLVSIPVAANAAEPVGTAILTEVDVPGTLIQSAAAVDLAAAGYTETEYYASGTANRYDGTAGTTTATVLDGGHAYTTRVIVRTPSPDKFNGSLVVEWNNVTIGVDGEFVFGEVNEYLLREGYAVAAVSAQRNGVETLKTWEPTRYGTLSVDANVCGSGGTSLCTGDPLSFDIFTQVAKAVADNSGGALAGLDVESVVATGQSQSGIRLATYYNTIQPIYDYFDGFVYHDRAAPLRADVDTPAITVDSDALHALGSWPYWQTSTWTRVWELAGGTHGSEFVRQYMDVAFARDQAKLGPDGQPITFTQWLEPSCAVVDTATGGQFGPVDTGYVLAAAFKAIQTWNATGEPAPPSIYFDRDAAGTPIRDAQHISQGGIHLPALVAPTMFFDAWNGPPYLFPCAVGGYHIDYTPAELKAMYGNHGKYVSLVSKTAQKLVEQGYLLAEDAQAEIRTAAQSDVAKKGK